jgi:hypothetical protein
MSHTWQHVQLHDQCLSDLHSVQEVEKNLAQSVLGVYAVDVGDGKRDREIGV